MGKSLFDIYARFSVFSFCTRQVQVLFAFTFELNCSLVPQGMFQDERSDGKKDAEDL